MVGPDRRVVHDPLGVVPHPVQVDQPAAGRLGGRQHGAVDIVRYADDHRGGRVAARPVTAYGLDVAADPTAGDHQGLCGEAELTDLRGRCRCAAGQLGGFEHRAGHAYARPLDLDRVHPVPRPDPHPARVQHPFRERLDQSRSGSPDQVEAGHRVAVPGRGVAAALGPLHQRKPANPELPQPAPLLAGCEVHVGLRPTPGPVVLGAIEGSAAQPVGQCELLGIVDPEPTLLRGVDHEQTTERPVRLAPERTDRLPVDDDHRAVGRRQLVRRHQSGQPGSDDDHIRVHALDAPRSRHIRPKFPMQHGKLRESEL